MSPRTGDLGSSRNLRHDCRYGPIGESSDVCSSTKNVYAWGVERVTRVKCPSCGKIVTTPSMSTKSRHIMGGKAARKEAGAYLQKLRTAKGLSQSELWKLLNKQGAKYEHYTQISQVETGYVSLPSDKISAWARALGADPKEVALTLLKLYDPHLFAAITGRG